MGSSGGPPNIGNGAFAVTLSGAPGGASAALLAGESKTYFGTQPVLPLNLAFIGATGCFLVTDPSLIIPVAADGSGFAAFNAPIPLDPVLVHLTAFVQWAVLDSTANPLGVTLSRGAAIRVGP
jgi:hypothetical protein